METKLPTVAFGSESLKLKIGNVALVCFILDNGQRILTKNSMQKALGYDGKSDNWLFEFLINVNRLTPVEPVILEALGKDILYTTDSSVIKHAISPNLFVEACRAIVKANADGFLYVSEQKFAKAAENIVTNIGDADIEKLIDFASGYDLFKHNHKEALIRFMQSYGNRQYPIWVRSFPDHFLSAIFAFNGWTWKDLNEKSEKIGAYLNDIVFSRVDDRLFETLNSSKPKMKYRKQNTQEQYLENEDLRAHTSAIVALIRASERNETILEQLINKSFPKQRNLENVAAKKDAGTNTGVKLSIFNENLQKALVHKKK